MAENETFWGGSLKAEKVEPSDFRKKYDDMKRKGCIMPSMNLIKTEEEIEAIRKSGKINTAVLDYISTQIKEGMSTEQINQLVHSKTTEFGGVPAPLNYNGFPKSACTSVNNQICHGIPDKKDILRNGDIINVDVSTIYYGYFSDSSRTFCIGKVSNDVRKLVDTARQCVVEGLKEVYPWNFLGNVGYAVYRYAVDNGYSVVKELGGHGVGIKFHEDPFVSFITRPGTEMVLAPGMVFTVEPMINMGKDKILLDKENGWTVYTADGKCSAQWEVTVLVTDNGHEILAY